MGNSTNSVKDFFKWEKYHSLGVTNYLNWGSVCSLGFNPIFCSDVAFGIKISRCLIMIFWTRFDFRISAFLRSWRVHWSGNMFCADEPDISSLKSHHYVKKTYFLRLIKPKHSTQNPIKSKCIENSLVIRFGQTIDLILHNSDWP